MKTLLLSLLLCCGAAHAAAPQQIRHALYPKGLPVKVNPFTNRQELTEFLFLGSAQLPSGNIVAVTAERLSRTKGDTMHTVYVSVLRARGGLAVLDRVDVTADMPLFVEDPGHFHEAQALVTHLLADAKPVVMIELWNSVTGSAGAEALTDLFFVEDAAGKLRRALAVPAITTTGRLGAGESRGNESILAADLHGNLVVRRREVTRHEDITRCSDWTVEPYRLDEDGYARTAKAPDSAALITLPRLPFGERLSCAN
jgi:hypothetical protein